ncbi:MAG: exodeoxyribonuclease V subunit gamma [Acidimicrobiales bacterium]
MLFLTVAGSLEPLADALAATMAVPLADPFSPELIAVPGGGTGAWLRGRLAEQVGATARGGDGIAANLEVVFPATLVARAMGEQPGFGAWSVGPLTWAVHEVLVDQGDELGQATDAVRARAIADLFDRYALHRPSMVRAWSDGRDLGATGTPLPAHQRWQPQLWRAVQAALGGAPTDAERLHARARALRDADPGSLDDELAAVPARVALFGLGGLPAPHLDLVVALARHRDVHVLASTASGARWRAVAEALAALDPPLALPATRVDDRVPVGAGHPLVTAWGRTSREAGLLLADAVAAVDQAQVTSPEPEPPLSDEASVLARLQHGLRADVAPPGAPVGDQIDRRPPVRPDDPSLRWYRTYGPARQVEVLRDAILHLLEERDDEGRPRFEPRDIAVLCPDPASIAPLVEATFAGDPDHGVSQVPVQVADRSLRQDNALLDAAAALLDLLDGRFRVSSVLAFAGRPPVRLRFGLDADALGRISEWAEATNVRWGLDDTDQERFGLPADLGGVHTWRSGLDQLLLGAAMADRGQRLGPGEVPPFGPIEGDGVAVAGALAELVHHLGTAVDALRSPSTVADWAADLAAALRSLCAVPDDDAWQWRVVERTLAELAAEATTPDGEPRPQVVEPADLAALVRGRLAAGSRSPRLRSGAVTVSSLTAQRGVPFPVVCLLGLDDDVASGGLAAEDLIAAEPCVGDPDPRGEQRAQLLDAVLSAGERLVVCSTGRDLRTNAEVPPSVALAELFDVVDATVRLPDELELPGDLPAWVPRGAERARDLLTVDHPRQAWSERALQPGALGVAGPWSFDEGARRAALARRAQVADVPFLDQPLPAVAAATATRAVDPSASGEWRVIDLRDLEAALTRPAQVLLRNRLGVWLPGDDEVLDDQIPLTLGGLDRWKLSKALLDAALAPPPGPDEPAVDLRTWEQVERRKGTVPPLAFGDGAVASAHTRVAQLRAQLLAELGPQPYEPVTVPLEAAVPGAAGGAVVVVGAVSGVCGDVVTTITPSSLRPHHVLVAWLRLALLAASDPDRPWRALTIGGKSQQANKLVVHRIALRGREGAAEAVDVVLDLLERSSCDAVPFFPATSRALVRDGVPAARSTWFDKFGEAEDEWNRRLFPSDFDLLLALALRDDEAAAAADLPEPAAAGRLWWWAHRVWGAVDATAEVDEDEVPVPDVDPVVVGAPDEGAAP